MRELSKSEPESVHPKALCKVKVRQRGLVESSAFSEDSPSRDYQSPIPRQPLVDEEATGCTGVGQYSYQGLHPTGGVRTKNLCHSPSLGLRRRPQAILKYIWANPT